MKAVYKERLLNAAKAVREGKPENFDMAVYARCGTPACVLGHYAFRTDLQDAFEPSRGLGISARSGMFPFGEACRHFGLTLEEGEELFGIDGCGNTQSSIEAADYIEDFITRKEVLG